MPSRIRQLDDARAPRRGHGLVDLQVTTRPIHRSSSLPPASATEAQQRLTARELQVLRQLAQGLSNAEIATALTIEEGTAEAHVSAWCSGSRDGPRTGPLTQVTPGDELPCTSGFSSAHAGISRASGEG
ncbi:LuxR C-terminal-related transcriptional regulator (plasmid) [Actinomadura sp. ATCC 31491]|uniref:LuxR C-terminal-related transcriptional regulator n=1 Tax=Actinomadura luzonensis TaxID=2805427 RepID=A0ABT0GD22_9ACTN|nr:LuxR C-terminal-related transcriptional regulator [Actinomadura luzonensis]MCK2222001.1 LuxR C-terminal-related transcriptional regulator [Actinomadura luzonensis]